MEPKLLILRSKKIGVCLKDARLKARKTVDEAASTLGISAENYTAMEAGAASPSFPQLESLALLYHAPFDSLVKWHGNEAGDSVVDPAVMKKVVTLREHVVAATLVKARQEKGVSAESMAAHLGISAEELQHFERAEKEIPYPLLEEACQFLGLDLPMLHSSRLSPHPIEVKPQEPVQEFAELPAEMVDFIQKPINRPYLELAKKLSDMNVDKLRTIAESLLEITY
jgi:transcriptional regulator with XRE-family HTH domain